MAALMDELMLAIVEDRRRGEGLLCAGAAFDLKALDEPLTAERAEVGEREPAADPRAFDAARRSRS
jgi:hypothetical protein